MCVGLHDWGPVAIYCVLCVGLHDWSPVAIYCVLCVGLRHCQHSAAPLLLSCTVTLASSVYKTVYSNVLFYCDKTVGQQQREERELRHTEMLYGVRCLV